MHHAVLIALGAAAALGWAPPPPEHAILEESVPAAGDTVATVPAELTLRFSGPIERSGATLHVLGTESRVWTLEARRQPGDARTLVADMPALQPGGYRVAWRVISADGHPIGGEFVFYVRGASAESVELGDPPPAGDVPAGAHAGGERAPHVALHLIVLRAAADLALLPLAGLLFFAAWGRGTHADRTDRSLRVLSIAAPVLTMAYAWFWAGEALPVGGSRLAGLSSLTTGRALGAETALALLVPWALLLAGRLGLAALLALLAVGAGGLGGHPASYTPMLSLPASAAHVLAAAIWLGGLAFLVTERGSNGYEATVHRVSTAALVSVGVVAVTGIVQTLAIVDSLDLLLTSGFGLTVLAKVAAFAGLIAFGAHHRLHVAPTAGTPEGANRLSRSVVNELALATCVVVLAALLSHIPPNS